MTLKKYLTAHLGGQVVMEYIIIFIAITLLMIGFISKAHNESKNGILDVHFQEMVNQTLG